VLAQEAAFQLGLDSVVLVPVGESPYKRIDPEPGREVRLEMARLAANEDSMIEASDVETAREGPSFSFRTLELMSDARPGDEFVFLMGADVAAGLESWRERDRARGG
jgi:nicotinate-nucleotide adenylyltransferase